MGVKKRQKEIEKGCVPEEDCAWENKKG